MAINGKQIVTEQQSAAYSFGNVDILFQQICREMQYLGIRTASARERYVMLRTLELAPPAP